MQLLVKKAKIMTRFLSKVLPVFIFASSFAAAEQTHNNLLPNFQFFFNPALSEGTDAFSFMGELGTKNLRGNATYGRSFAKCQRFKLSAEYLAQKLKYHFIEHTREKWVSQVGFGGSYQYLFAHSPFVGIDADLAYSHAFNRHLGTRDAIVHGQPVQERRRIAGSDAVLSYLGTTLQLWHCGFFSAGADYDWVDYHRISRKKRHVSGFGTSLGFKQQFGKSFHLALETEFRRPFNFYQTLFNWNRSYSGWALTCGIYGNYTHGKHDLPNVVAAGVQLGFTFGGKITRCCRSTSSDCRKRISCDLSNWVQEPAFYSPVVLAIADRKVTLNSALSNCPPPTSVAIPLLDTNANPYSINVGGFFSSSRPLTFTATGLPPGSTINPTTGVISGPNPQDGIHAVTVTATSVCGSISQEADLNLFGP